MTRDSSGDNQSSNDITHRDRRKAMKMELKPIGTIHTPYRDNAPYQPVENASGDFELELYPEYKDALHKLETFNYIYVIYWLHRARSQSENIVSPPWTQTMNVGLFASRSPRRPNAIGLSIVKILGIKNNIIKTSGLDAFDGTPLLDIKPYIRELDSKSDANYGWLEETESREHLLFHIKGIPHDH